MKNIIYTFVFLVAAFGATSCSDDYNAPTSTRNEFINKYPNAVDVEWEKRRGYVVAEFEIPGEGECEAWYTKGGVWVMTKVYDINIHLVASCTHSIRDRVWHTGPC